jgi:hypothetical protein
MFICIYQPKHVMGSIGLLPENLKINITVPSAEDYFKYKGLVI